MSATVKDVMSTHVVAVRQEASFKVMAARLRQYRVSAFPVIDSDRPVTHAARLMYSRKVKRLPVVDAENRLVGIVSRADVLNVYSRPDEDIKREITGKVILGEFFCDPDRFTVTVSNGIVTIEGRPETADGGHAIIAAVWHVEGVVSVRDRLAYPPAEGIPAIGPLF